MVARGLRLRLGAFAVLAAVAACGGAEPKVGFVTDATIDGLPRAAAAIHDPDQDVYFVSGTAPGEAPYGSGYIARVEVDGQVTPRWISGGEGGVLRDPRGMAIVGDELWVADLDTVRCFDRRHGRPTGAIAIPAAEALADVSATPGGSVWVSDGNRETAGLVLVDTSRQVRRIELSGDLPRPTALVAQAHGAYLVTQGGDFVLVDENGHVERLSRTPEAGLRGLCRVTAGRWLAAGEVGRCIYAFDMRGGAPAQLSMPPLDGPGDFGFDERRQLLLVPLATSGRLAVRRLPPAR